MIGLAFCHIFLIHNWILFIFSVFRSLPHYSQHLLVLLIGTFYEIHINSERGNTGMTAEALGISVAPSFFHTCVSEGKIAKPEEVQKFKVWKLKNCNFASEASLSSLHSCLFSIYNIISELKNTLFGWGYRTKRSIFFVHVFCIFVILKYFGTCFGKGDKRLSNFFLAPLGVPWRLFNPTVGKWPCSSQINSELYKSEYCKFWNETKLFLRIKNRFKNRKEKSLKNVKSIWIQIQYSD